MANRGTSSAVAGTISATQRRRRRRRRSPGAAAGSSAKPASEATSTLERHGDRRDDQRVHRGPAAGRRARRRRAYPSVDTGSGTQLGRRRRRQPGLAQRAGHQQQQAAAANTSTTKTAPSVRAHRALPGSDTARGRAAAPPRRASDRSSVEVEPPRAQAVRRGVQDPLARHDRQAGRPRRWACPARPAVQVVVPAASRSTPKSVAAYRSPVASSRTSSVTGWSPKSYDRSTQVEVPVAGL